jgi:hypothetical protein
MKEIRGMLWRLEGNYRIVGDGRKLIGLTGVGEWSKEDRVWGEL